MRLKELQELIIKEFGDEDNNINLKGLDFSGKCVNLSYMKAEKIYNDNQQAEDISNQKQEAKDIHNSYQEAEDIYNKEQKAEDIHN